MPILAVPAGVLTRCNSPLTNQQPSIFGGSNSHFFPVKVKNQQNGAGEPSIFVVVPHIFDANICNSTSWAGPLCRSMPRSRRWPTSWVWLNWRPVIKSGAMIRGWIMGITMGNHHPFRVKYTEIKNQTYDRVQVVVWDGIDRQILSSSSYSNVIPPKSEPVESRGLVPVLRLFGGDDFEARRQGLGDRTLFSARWKVF